MAESEVELLPCPFCGAQPYCTHGFERCKVHEHYDGDGIRCDTPMECVIVCPTDGCPASRGEQWMLSSIETMKVGPWSGAYAAARVRWNRRTAPQNAAQSDKA